MNTYALLQHAETRRTLGVLGLALSGLMLMGFHSVVNSAVERAQRHHAEEQRQASVEAPCRALHEAASQALCLARLQVPAEGFTTVALLR